MRTADTNAHGWRAASAKRLSIFLLFAAFVAGVRADEIHSSGLGLTDGRWDDPATWKGKKVPTMTDTVVIAPKDTVIFNRDDSGKNTCKDLRLDPGSALLFETGKGPRVLCVDGIIESYGTLRMDASRLREDSMALRMVGATAEQRAIKMMKGASLIVAGHPDIAEGKHNATLISWPPGEGKAPIPATITAGERCVLDFQRADITHIVFNATSIDNTNSKPNEKVSFIENHFSGLSSIYLVSCDTPCIKKNIFTATKDAPVGVTALNLYACPLADILGNKITGPYPTGIGVTYECTVKGNIVEKCTTGIICTGANIMLKDNRFSECDTGIYLASATGSVEEIEIDKPKVGILANASVCQITSVAIKNVQPKGFAIDMDSSSLTILNCNLKPDQIHCGRTPNADATLPWVDTMQFLVVKAKGNIRAKTQVEVKTKTAQASTNLVLDLNVRNSPAMMRPDGYTPISSSALILRSWKLGRDGKVVPAPEYLLSVWVPKEKPGEKGKPEAKGKPEEKRNPDDDKEFLLHDKLIKPDDTWFRPRPGDPNQFMEITLP